MKLSEYKNEDALDLLADILDPLSEILMDSEFQKLTKESGTKMKVVQFLLKNHKKHIIEIMARLDNVPVEEYEMNVLTFPKKILEIMNDKELVDFFRVQGQMMEDGISGPAMENTEETGEI
jgi:hypothetical protein